jgi:spermidine/putrescine transport system permease protein
MDLGATPRRAFWKVTFPLILPGVLAAALLSFALSIDDFIITFFNAGSLMTFPLQIFGASRVAIPAQINVLATMLLLGSIAIMVVGLIIESRRQRLNTGSKRKR